MKQEKLLTNILIVVVAVTLAGVLGQIRRWNAEIKVEKSVQTSVTSSGQRKGPELLVKFKDGVSEDQIRTLLFSKNDVIEDVIETVSGLFSIDDLDDENPEAVAERYRSFSDLVEYAEPITEIRISSVFPEDSTPSDPLFPKQWHLNNSSGNGDIRALTAWNRTHGSENIVVAVLDTGVDYNHPDLSNNIWERPSSIPAYFDTELGAIDDRFGFNAIRNDADPMDENGHGTHVAGIIGAEGDNGIGITGINWEVQILPLKFMGANGSGTTKDAIEAINYAIERKRRGVNIRVINASWGSGVYSRALEDVIRSAAAEGILFVAAAGNSSSDNDRIPHYPSNYRLPNVISVAATDESDNLAGFSSYGGKSVHISAPGRNILSTWLGGEYKEASGTSMAAPQVAGIAALILSLDSDMGLIELKETLLKSHDPNPSFSGKLLNAGRISAAKALGE
jgi:subtilisin family serine protease